MQKENKTGNVEITYIFNAPCSIVFKAWTDPEFLKQWYAPDGCTVEFKKCDIKVGGTFHSCIRNPQFGDCWCIGVYEEIIDQKKIAYTLINADEHGNPVNPISIGMDSEWPGETLVTVLFSESEGKTTIVLKQNVSESIAKRTGAHPSWIQMFERMEQTITNLKN